MNFSFATILERLNPLAGGGDPMNIIWKISLYLIFFFSLIFLFRQKIPNQNVMILAVAAMLLAMVDMVGVSKQEPRLFPATGCNTLPVMFIRAGMFASPILAMSISKSPKSRIWGILAAVTGFIYFMMRGVLEMGFLQFGQTCNFGVN
jgi:hypothetical protein